MTFLPYSYGARAQIELMCPGIHHGATFPVLLSLTTMKKDKTLSYCLFLPYPFSKTIRMDSFLNSKP